MKQLELVRPNIIPKQLKFPNSSIYNSTRKGDSSKKHN